MKVPFPRQINKRRAIEGGVLIHIGGTILLLIPVEIRAISTMETKLSPSFLPAIVAILIILMGIALIVQSILFHSAPESEASKSVPPESIFRVILAILFLVAYSLIFPIIGFVVTSALFFFIYAYLFGLRNIVKITSGGIISSVVVWLFFEKLFNIPLPHGVLF